MSPPRDDADLSSLDDEQRALFEAAFGIPQPDDDAVDCGVDTVMARLGGDERHEVVRAAFGVTPPSEAHREASIASIMDRVGAQPAPARTLTPARWRPVHGVALAAIVLLVGLTAWMFADRQDGERPLRSYDRDQVQVRQVESPQGLVSVQKVSQEAARRIVQRIGGGGSDTARKATGRQLR